MNAFRALYVKELQAIFFAPVAYAIVSVFALLMAYTFCAQLFHTRNLNLVAMHYQAASLFLLIVPLVTMRQFAEERSSRTLELLLSTPLSDRAIVAAKYLASMTLMLMLIALMLINPAAVAALCEPDWGLIACGCVGLVLLASALVSLGLAVSALTRSQVAAGIVSLGLFLLLWMVEVLGVYLPPPFDAIAVSLSFDNRLSPFATGVLYLSDVGFFLILTLLGALFAVGVLSHR